WGRKKCRKDRRTWALGKSVLGLRNWGLEFENEIILRFEKRRCAGRPPDVRNPTLANPSGPGFSFQVRPTHLPRTSGFPLQSLADASTPSFIC
ncbi:MAG: hypothetical protein ACKOC0_02265, partial [Cytophagales bacterium]